MPPLNPAHAYLLRCLRKSAIVFIAMNLMDYPTGETELASLLDLTPTTVRAYLRSLAVLGLITRTSHHQGWTLTGRGRQMLLSPGDPADDDLISAETAKFSPTTASAYYLNTDQNLTAEEETGTGKFYRFDEPAPLTPHAQENLDALRQYGVGKNDRTRAICEQEHMTPEYIHFHGKKLRAERRLKPGLLITILESGDPLPVEEDPEQQRLRDDEAARYRYLNWGK